MDKCAKIGVFGVLLFFIISQFVVAESNAKSKLYLDSVYIYANYTYTDSMAAQQIKNRLIESMKVDSYVYAKSIEELYIALNEEASGDYKKARDRYRYALKALGGDYKNSFDALNIYFSIQLYSSNMEMLEYNYMESLRILYSLELELKKRKPEWLVEVYNNLASIYSELEENFLFKKYLNKASEIVRISAPLETYLTVRLNEASTLYSTSDYQSSLQQLNSFKDSIYFNENTYLDLEEMYWCLYALNCYELGKLDDVKMALVKFYAIETKDPYYRAKSLMLEMMMNSESGKVDNLQSKVDEAYAILSAYDNPHLMKDYYTIMQGVYPNNKDSLIKYYRYYMLYEDSVRHLSHSDVMLGMEKQQALYDLDAEYQTVSDELDHQVKVNQVKSVVIAMVIVILGLMLTIVYLVWKRNIRLNVQIKQFVETNKELYKIKKQGVGNKSQVSSSSQSKGEDQILILGWEELMCKQKRYTNLQLTLSQIAKELNTNTSYLSAQINQNYGKNFNKLVNEYRVKEVLSLLHGEDMQMYTIEHLANKAGFKSMSSFYGVFKETTGVTPKQYLNELKKQMVNSSVS